MVVVRPLPLSVKLISLTIVLVSEEELPPAEDAEEEEEDTEESDDEDDEVDEAEEEELLDVEDVRLANVVSDVEETAVTDMVLHHMYRYDDSRAPV